MPGGTVILAAGEFPKPGTLPWLFLDGAARVVCCDGAADAYRRRFRREPDLVVGDLDSVTGRFANVLKVDDQDTNDLEKAVAACRARGWDDITVVGATGLREDHTVGNVFRALALEVPIVTAYGRFLPFVGTLDLLVAPGAAVSVFAPDPATRMTSRGLAWPLDGVRFTNLFCATLNRATAGKLVLTADRPVLVYVAQ